MIKAETERNAGRIDCTLSMDGRTEELVEECGALVASIAMHIQTLSGIRNPIHDIYIDLIAANAREAVARILEDDGHEDHDEGGLRPRREGPAGKA